MDLPNRPCQVLASAMLVAFAFGTAPGAACAQGAMGGAARDLERRSAQVARLQAERRLHIARGQAHARMPSTMYASTPDPASPPHPVPVDVDSKRPSAPVRISVKSGEDDAGASHFVGLFPSAADALGRQGFARVVNHSEVAGEVRIDAYDDAGVAYGPVTVSIGAGETVHFNSEDLETGNAGKGLDGRTGEGEGSWRLELGSTLELEVFAYIRTRDGFLTAMHDVAPTSEAGHRVVTFNPGRNVNQVSRLRLINPGAEAAEVRIEGTDDAGASSAGAVEFTLAPGASRPLGARELESGEAEGLSGALGTGAGKWRLRVTSAQPVEVMSLLSSPTGHLTNLSTVPDATGSGDDGVAAHGVALFPSASDAQGRQGFVRVVNRTDHAGEVRIDAWDDEGVQVDSVMLAVGAGETKHFNSDDLETGNAEKGLEGATGSGAGDWRLELTSGLDIEVLAYIRTEDGFLTAMHDVAPSGGAGHRVVTFNPGRNVNQVSWLRLVNPGAGRAEVIIEGVDDKGASPGGAVELSLEPGASRTFSARELESGRAEGLSGALGTGGGKWRLAVTSDRPVQVMSLLSSPTGHLTNLSTVPHKVALGGEETAEEVFREHISGPIVQGKCIACHVDGGVSGNTRLVFVRASQPEHEARNLRTFETFLAEVDDGASLILNKIQGVAHGGGAPVPAGTQEFADMERFLRLLGEDVSTAPVTVETLFDQVRMAPLRKTLRRAALIFAGRIPTDEEYAAAQRGGTGARETIRGLMTGPQFHEFLIRGSNDRLLTDRDDFGIIDRVNFVEFAREKYRRSKAAHESGNEHEYDRWYNRVQHGARRAPLELIAYVAENDRPYTEILTADYIMANPWTAAAYGAPTHHFDDPTDFNEFKPSRIEDYYRAGEGFEVEPDPVGERIVSTGSLSTEYPHAGVLNTTMFLKRYPTTATNRNRARSRWTYYHFLGLDIEKSASRTTDPDALADTNNPTMFNPACTVCHVVLDPVAGAFQNYGDDGFYKDQWGGLDSLDTHYKNDAGGPSLAVRAESWAERETLSWPVWMAAGVGNLRVLFTNPVYKREVYLDRLRVTDARGQVLASREFEDLGPPVHPDSEQGHSCGATGRNSSGREEIVTLWWGSFECAIYMDVEVPSDGVYNIEIVAWSNGYIETQYGEDGFARLSVASNVYEVGDTWYRDMRTPGFADELAPNPDNSVQWLARKIVAEERFAEAAVKFWWPAIMGSEVAEPPEDEEDAVFEGLLLAANAQGAEVERLARGFRGGFSGRRRHNLKDLLVELVLSRWFRADTVEDTDAVRRVALRDAGARRLLTPEELARKTAAITGVQWARGLSLEPWDGQWPNALTGAYRLLYGGIDSDGITERARDITSVMAGVAKAHATQMSCPIVMRELFLLPDSERLLFSGVDTQVTPGSESGTNAIRGKLVELHEKLLGVRVTPHSPDVEAAFRLFVDVWERKRGSQDTETNFRSLKCEWWHDIRFLDGILDDPVVEPEFVDGNWSYGYDWGHVDEFMNGIDWSDRHYTAQTWMVVLAYLMMDYRYLYL